MSPADLNSRGSTALVSSACPRIIIAGVHDSSDAYPNVKYRVLGFHNAKGILVREYRYTFRWRPFACRRRSWWSRLASIVGMVFGAFFSHLRAVIACVLYARSESVYVPYPAPLVLFCLSFLPQPLRPGKIVADAFISLYDTMVFDRAMISGGGLPARLLRWMERRSYRFCDLVVADTEMNAAYLTQIFQLPAGRVIALPLAIGEQIYSYTPYIPHDGQRTVLFIGTFVPLQGTDVIAEAVSLLRNEPGIHFRIIGYGQTAESARESLERHACRNYVWIEEWQDAAALAKEIRRADICLGIFGATDKAQRVWPLKNYAYMACGRTIITGETNCARSLIRGTDRAPFATVPTGDPQALAAAILSLACDDAARTEYANLARGFYERHLANAISIDAILREMLH